MVGPPGGSRLAAYSDTCLAVMHAPENITLRKELVGLQDLSQSVRICMLMLTLPRYLISPTGLGVMQRLPHSVAWK